MSCVILRLLSFGLTKLAFSNYDLAKGAVRAPWLAWGPYFWADGVKSRSDGLQWLKEDLQNNDHTHPGPKGREKISAMLLDFVKTDPTARVWFVK